MFAARRTGGHRAGGGPKGLERDELRPFQLRGAAECRWRRSFVRRLKSRQPTMRACGHQSRSNGSGGIGWLPEHAACLHRHDRWRKTSIQQRTTRSLLRVRAGACAPAAHPAPRRHPPPQALWAADFRPCGLRLAVKLNTLDTCVACSLLRACGVHGVYVRSGHAAQCAADSGPPGRRTSLTPHCQCITRAQSYNVYNPTDPLSADLSVETPRRDAGSTVHGRPTRAAAP